MIVNESAENYLETVLILGQNGSRVRSIDIVNELEFSKPSVSVAMKNLREKGLITVDANGYIELTESGRKIAESIYERHMLISDWLIYLGVDRKTAVHDACRMEHGMSEQSYLAIKAHVENWKREEGLSMQFRHVTLSVKDLDESIKFYRDIVGLSITRRFAAGPGREIVFLGSGATEVELISGGAGTTAGTGISMGFATESPEDTMALLREKGFDIEGPMISPNPQTRFFFVKDPDGHRVQFINME